MGVGLQQRVVLLSIDTVNRRLDVINSPTFHQLASFVHMINNLHRFSAFSAVDHISKHVSFKPLCIVELDVRAEGLVVEWRFYLAQASHLSLIELVSRLNHSFIRVQNVKVERVRVRSCLSVAG